LGILLLTTGLLGLEAVVLMLPLPLALLVLVNNRIKRKKRREEQVKALEMTKGNTR
jgi:hypothetical protein